MYPVVFNDFYQNYDSWYRTSIGKIVDEIETQALFSVFFPKVGMKVLDIGCGTGHFSFKLVKKGCEVVGIDLAEKMLMQAHKKKNQLYEEEVVEFQQMNGEQLTFEDNTFDAVISMASAEFMPNLQAVFDEMYRVVKSEGTIVIGTIQKGGEWAELYSSDFCKDTAYAYAQFKTKEELIQLAPNLVENSQECLFLPPTLSENMFTLANEKKRKEQQETGGFVCVKFKK